MPGTGNGPKKKPGGHRAQKMNRKDSIRKRVINRIGKTETIVEVGVWRGRFSKLMLEELAPRKLYLVDPWVATSDSPDEDALTTEKGTEEMERIFRFVQNRFEAEIAAGQVEIMRDYSHTALPKFADESVDLVYIDGDHSYEGVARDLSEAWRIIEPGGKVMLDDYHRMGWWGDDVLRAVHEFIAAHITDLRIRDVLGAQIVLEKHDPVALAAAKAHDKKSKG